MFRSGAFVADHVTPVDETQVQPNGVDLTVDAIFEQDRRGRIIRGDTHSGSRREVPFESVEGRDQVYLGKGGYVVQYAETVHIPEGLVGFIYPRSSLMRNSCMLNTAVWDAGYEGKGEGLLQVHHFVELERGARIAQLVLAEASHEGTYDGSYQGERVE